MGSSVFIPTEPGHLFRRGAKKWPPSGRNGWPPCLGMGGRFRSEWVAGLARNMHRATVALFDRAIRPKRAGCAITCSFVTFAARDISQANSNCPASFRRALAFGEAAYKAKPDRGAPGPIPGLPSQGESVFSRRGSLLPRPGCARRRAVGRCAARTRTARRAARQ